MVRGPSRTIDRFSSGPATKEGSALTTSLSSVPSKSPHASADCMERLQRFAGHDVFSREGPGQLAFSRWESTHLNYQSEWKVNCD